MGSMQSNEEPESGKLVGHAQIAAAIRGKIIGGELSPNEQLPELSYFEEELGYGQDVVQLAIDQLASAGFLEDRGISGVFVAVRPPSVCNIPVIADISAPKEHTSIFQHGLVEEFIKRNELSDKTFRLYCCKHRSLRNSDFGKVVKDVSNQSVAGLIFLGNPFPYDGTVLLSQPNIPRVAIMGRKGQEKKFHTATVVVGDSFIEKALDHFVETGRKKVALISNPRQDYWWEQYHQLAAERGIETRPYWTICTTRTGEYGVGNLAQMLLHLAEDKLPDAILITDDNLAEPAIAGLMASHASVLHDLEIVCHCNYPYPVMTPLQVRHLGVDLNEVINACIRCLDRQRNGEDAADVSETVEPFFARSG